MLRDLIGPAKPITFLVVMFVILSLMIFAFTSAFLQCEQTLRYVLYLNANNSFLVGQKQVSKVKVKVIKVRGEKLRVFWNA